MNMKLFVAAAGLFMSAHSFANAADPIYALFETTMSGPKGTVTSVEVVVVDGGRAVCEDLLAGLINGQAKSQKGQEVRGSIDGGRRGCTSELPSEFQPVIDGKGLADAFYIERTLTLPEEEHQFYTVFYGLDVENPGNTCSSLIVAYAQNRNFKNLSCHGPVRTFKSINGKALSSK